MKRVARAIKRPFKALEERLFPGRVFERIYEKGRWKSGGTASGAGSTMENTEQLRQHLPAVLARLEIRSFLDIPCGDFNWIKELDYEFERYIGGDIVESLVQANRARHAAANRRFERLDVIADPLPAVDMIMCRDCWVHLSNKQVLRAIANLRRSGSTYLLATTYPVTGTNVDIGTGNWRPVNLQAAPFNLPPPLELVPDPVADPGSRWPDKSLGLWRVSDLP